MAECDHGCPPPRKGRDPHLDAMEDLIDELAKQKNDIDCFGVFTRHEECVDMTTIKLLTAMATNHIRMGHVFLARRLAEVILAMEQYLFTDEQTAKELKASIGEDGITHVGEDGKRKYFTDSDKDLFEQFTALQQGDPEVIRFFAQRIPCDCLNDKIWEISNQPRIGRCVNPSCFKAALDSTLMDCGRCRLSKYCSKECQRAHWPKHRQFCSMATVTYKCHNQHCCTRQTTNLFDCARCKKVKYCSKACQKADWPLHKRSCGTVLADGDN